MQPPPYTRDVDFSEAERSNAGGRSTVSTSDVDAELDAIAQTFAVLLPNLALIQRDDGKLRDAVVELYNLSQAARLALAVKWNPRGLWASGLAYAVGDLVDMGGAAYVCSIAHASGVFATDYAAGRWQIFNSLLSAAGLAFAPTATVLSTNVQAAITEVDAKLRQALSPYHHAFLGGL